MNTLVSTDVCPFGRDNRNYPVFQIPVCDFSMNEALEALVHMIETAAGRSRAVFFVNAHTLNTAFDQVSYRQVLRNAAYVFGDGTGVRWAVRLLHGVRLRDNVNGTDLIPRLFSSHPDRGYRYFLLGNTPERIERAAQYAQQTFSAWKLGGYHHGYLEPHDTRAAIEQINASKSQVLLVGMGNPKQERWIAEHLHELNVPICMGTGGLFDYWSGDLERAPKWMRVLGYEWLHLLIRQPHKSRRYLFGNPRFLLRLRKSHKISSKA